MGQAILAYMGTYHVQERWINPCRLVELSNYLQGFAMALLLG